MRRLFYAGLLFVVLQNQPCAGQDTAPSVFPLNKLSPGGIILNNGWKSFAGDDPRFAKVDYDDSNWKTFSPIIDIRNVPAAWRTGVGWLRLHLDVDSLLAQEQLLAMVDQFLASEIYLNGRLIARFGSVNSELAKAVASTPEHPVPLRLNAGHNVFAVRFAVQPGLNFSSVALKNFLIPFFSMRISPASGAFREMKRLHQQIPTANAFRIGACFILFCLYLSFFLYNPAQKAYLFFSLYLMFMMPGDILQFNVPNRVDAMIATIRSYYILWQLSRLFLLTALYSLLHQKKGWIYWSLTIAMFVGIILSNWMFSELIVGNLINLELVRMGFRSLKLKTRGAWIITAGCISFLFLTGAFVMGTYLRLGYWFIPLGDIYIMADLLYALGSLSIPVATLIYIALDFAFTNQRLKQKLGEVEELSHIKLEQEKEKQQILSSQKEMLERQVAERTADLRQSLDHLKSTQSQLIQSEKMASLGELTAGIAHEIQNPLNFVNNFSDVSTELIDELKGRLASDRYRHDDRQQALELADDIKQNLGKIAHHGRRADAIVKGMLQHSRTSSGQKEPTDVNALVEEYLKLAYHGLRAKDKGFNATLNTNFDNNVGKINIIPQDIGRVILNMVNNAFYAVNEKQRTADQAYEPTVLVSTKKQDGMLEISVKDNGNGIPDSLKEKIFQPFFTTKPPGQGTGLGLSLAYDIVTKGHGGELRVETEESKGSKFVIKIPGN